jgi:hypothetical protein
MTRRPYNKTRQNKTGFTDRRPTDEYDFFTGGGTEIVEIDGFVKSTTKTADFTIYYNLAVESVNAIQQQIKDQSKELQNAFWVEHFWKAHLQSKNSDGYQVTEKDKRIIAGLITKVTELRNYHSHIWHDNSVLEFSEELKVFTEQKYEEAKAGLISQYPGAVADFEALLKKDKYKKKQPLFKKAEGKNFITTEGRVFFLGFFLSTGQMNQFLQQRSGYKRSDLPEFKIKRILYTFYCNRDGAAIAKFNHEERVIDQLDKNTRQNILKARTAYKLLSYLVDYPEYWGNKDDMPLFDNNNEPIKQVKQLKQFIEQENLLHQLSFTLIERTAIVAEDEDTTAEATIKEHEDKYRLGSINFKHADLPDYTFQINFDTLYRLVLLELLKDDSFNPLSVLNQILANLVANRKELYRVLIKPANKRDENEVLYLLSKENQYLRGQRRVTEKGIIFFDGLQNGVPEKSHETILLANYLRDENTPWLPVINKKGVDKDEFAPEPIQVYQQDFILGQEQKFRAGNRFVFYAAKFLMDFAGDQWYWGMENFSKDALGKNAALVKTKKYFKASEIPNDGDYRLTIEDDHIYIALLKNADAEKNHERFYQFAIGPTALRYLACYIKDNEKNYAEAFCDFLKATARDIEKLKTQTFFDEADGYELLEHHFVAGYVKANNGNVDKLVQQVKSRIAYIKNEWDVAINNKQYLSRSQKNRLIMDAYRLFDWSVEGRSDGKFLRANEYNQMSVCHYSLVNLEAKPLEGRAKLNELYNRLFKLNNRQPPVQDEIKKLLFAATSLDNLMERIFKNRSVYLQGKIDLPLKFLKKALPELCRQLGISIPIGLLTDEPSKRQLAEKHQKTLEVQPFVIHPMMVLKNFFKAHYKQSQPIELVKELKAVPVFENVRKNVQLNNVLHKAFYDSEIAAKLYSKPECKKARHKLIGLMNTTFTEDILLWWMAQRYLNNNDFTKAMGELVTGQQNIKITNLHSLQIQLQLKRGTETAPGQPSVLLDRVDGNLFTSVLMHQLDDMMFMTEQSRLRKAAVHFINRCTVEKEIWATELENMATRQLGVQKLPDGTKGQPIPFQVLRDELELVRRTGQKLADYILLFEKRVLQKQLDEKFKGDKLKYQKYLKTLFEEQSTRKKCESDTSDYKAHVNFETIVSFAGETHDELKKLSLYRPIAFHNDVPIGTSGSFAWLTREGTGIRNFLQITENLNAKKDRTAYLPTDIAD